MKKSDFHPMSTKLPLLLSNCQRAQFLSASKILFNGLNFECRLIFFAHWLVTQMLFAHICLVSYLISLSIGSPEFTYRLTSMQMPQLLKPDMEVQTYYIIRFACINDLPVNRDLELNLVKTGDDCEGVPSNVKGQILK